MKKTMMSFGLASVMLLTLAGGVAAWAQEPRGSQAPPPPPQARSAASGQGGAAPAASAPGNAASAPGKPAPAQGAMSQAAYQELLASKSEAILQTAAEMGIEADGLELRDVVKAIGDTDREKVHALELPPPPRGGGKARPQGQDGGPAGAGGNGPVPGGGTPGAPTGGTAPVPTPGGDSSDTVVISGGFETNPVDKGRPVVLIAAVLGVPTEVFREAFSGVRPAGLDRGPTMEEAQTNKAALMKVLGPYGITNERLDEVSNYYRYNGSKGGLWPVTPAAATVEMTDGVITGVTITNPGSGYSSNPTITVMGPDGPITATATVAYGTDFATNGSIVAITLP